MTDTSYRWGLIPTRFSTFAAAVDEQGRVVRFWLHTDRKPRGIEDDSAITEVRRQVEAYSAGELKDFDLVTHTDRGSDFEHGVWQAMTEIPFGETVSYGYIAKKLGQPDAARAVGVACNGNPIPLIVPCHRVIGADGALVGFGGGLPLKRALLDHESVVAGRPRDLLALL